MIRDGARWLWGLSAVVLILASPGIAGAAGVIHVIVATDDLDRKVGESVALSGGAFGGLFMLNVPADRYTLTNVSGETLSPNAILNAVNGLNIRAKEDVVVVYAAMHGGFDPNQGSYLYFPRTRQTLTRRALKAAIEAKNARLGVLITESCNNVKEIPAPPPKVAAPTAIPPQEVAPLMRALFLSHIGFVDMASSRQGERSLCYPKLRVNGKLIVDRGALFTDAMVNAMWHHMQDQLTWSRLRDEVAPIVRAEFRRVAPEGLEDEDQPNVVQRTQTVDLRSPGTWSPSNEPTTRFRLGAIGQGVLGDGVKVTEVFDGSAAKTIGLEVGDVIRAINGERVDTTEGYIRMIKASGDQITFSVRDVRTGNIVQLQGMLDRGGNAGPPPAPLRPRFGAVAVNHNGGGGGLMITQIIPDTPAARIGYEYGDIILSINGRAINSQDEYIAAVRDSPLEMNLIVRNVRTGQPQSTKLTLDR